MPFINKRACMAACVSVYEDCSPHNTMHETDDYPLYYDALYFPELHLSTFKTMETVKAWLLAGIGIHEISCRCAPNDDATFSVEIKSDCFRISLGVQEALITADYIESASFTFCHLARMTANSPLNRNPAWIMYSETHYKENLECITRDILQASARNVLKIVPHRKKDIVDCLVLNFMRFRDQFVGHNSHCVPMDSSNFSRSARLLVISDKFVVQYGSCVSVAFQFSLQPATLKLAQHLLPK